MFTFAVRGFSLTAAFVFANLSSESGCAYNVFAECFSVGLYYACIYIST